MNLAEELFLCGIDEAGDSSRPELVPGVGGAVLAELVLARRVALEEDRLVLLDQAPMGDPILDDVLENLHQPFVAKMTPTALVLSVGMQAMPKVRQSVVEKGAVTAERARRRWLGLPKRDLLRLTPAGEEPRARLREGNGEDALVALAGACGLVEAPAPPAVMARIVEAIEAVDDVQSVRGN
jgi:hypothetical protein